MVAVFIVFDGCWRDGCLKDDLNNFVERLKRKTPSQGIGRGEYIDHLVEEFHTTTNIEAKEQITANLANFAYDPLNWKFLHDADGVKLFLKLLKERNERLHLHGLAGLCNICLDPIAFKYITKPANFRQLECILIKSDNPEIALSIITLLYQILNSNNCEQIKKLIITPDILKRIIHWRQNSDDLRINSICIIFQEDFGSRSETLLLPSQLPNHASTSDNITSTSL